MKRHLLLLAIFAAAAAPLTAQKPPPPPRNQPQPQTPSTPGKAIPPAAAAAAPARPPAAAAPVTPQAAHPAAPAASTFTAGLAMAPYTGATPDAALEYAARFGRLLDSAIVTLVDVFRNTSGLPMEGANSPADLSQRERDRWARCRNIYWDLTTFASAVATLRSTLPANPAVQRAAAELDSAFAASQALSECDNVASMIAAPDRWTPWRDQYHATAQHFYRDFYVQVREVHERDRAFVNALNGVLAPARRIPVPPGLPRNAPYAGGGPGE